MTPPRTSTGIAALDELGRRFDAVVEPPRLRRLRSRRWAALALGLLAAVATPAIAAVLSEAPERLMQTHGDLAAAITPDDPAATGRALEQLGYQVRWILITDNPDRARDGESPIRQRPVDLPPHGTKVLSVRSEDRSAPDTGARPLQIEISPVGSEILKSHE